MLKLSFWIEVLVSGHHYDFKTIPPVVEKKNGPQGGSASSIFEELEVVFSAYLFYMLIKSKKNYYWLAEKKCPDNKEALLTIGPCITPIWAPPAFSSKPADIWAAKFCKNTQ